MECIKKFHLRLPRLRLCWQHELAAISTVGSDFNGGFYFRLAWFRHQKTGLWMRQQLFAQQDCVDKEIRVHALNLQT
jgi:hypothetical protein